MNSTRTKKTPTTNDVGLSARRSALRTSIAHRPPRISIAYWFLAHLHRRRMSTPTHLTEEGIHIRPYTASDVDALHDAVAESIDALSVWLDWARDGYDRSDAQAWVRSRSQAWARKDAYSFAVVDAETGRFLGGVGLNQINQAHATANLGYWTRSSETGRGVASTAAVLAARFGLDTVGLNRVEILVPAGNAPSLSVAENAGAVREGTLRRRLVIGDEVHDAVCFSIVE